MEIKSYLLRLSASICLDFPDENLIFYRILNYIEKETDCIRLYNETEKKKKNPVMTFQSSLQSIKTVHLLMSYTVSCCQVMSSKEESSS